MKSFLIVDIETRIDKSLIQMTRYPHEHVTEDEAYQRYQAELIEKHGSAFLPVIYHRPISIAVGQVDAQYRLMSIETLGHNAVDEPGAESAMVEEFWTLVNHRPTLVTFNGRGFDLPVLELAALRYGIPASTYWVDKFGPRYRYQDDRHIDVADVLCNTGAVPRMRLNDLLIMLGYGGKGEMDGSQVEAMYADGRLDEIHAYCQRDVIQTWALWIRLELLRGRVNQVTYGALCRAAEPWLKAIR